MEGEVVEGEHIAADVEGVGKVVGDPCGNEAYGAVGQGYVAVDGGVLQRATHFQVAHQLPFEA